MSHYRLDQDSSAPRDLYQIDESAEGSPWDFPVPSAEAQDSGDFRLAGADSDRQASSGNADDSELLSVYRGAEGAVRADGVRRRLDEALEKWWSEGRVPSLGLLRDGLLVLEAGQSLDEAQRTLLLRAALLRQRGVLTAMRHQPDPERTASVLLEAVMTSPPLVSDDHLKKLLRTDPHSREWAPTLAQDLRVKIAISGSAGTGGQSALAVLSGQDDLQTAPPDEHVVVTEDEQAGAWRWWRVALLVMLIGSIVIYAIWQQRGGTRENVIAVAAAISPLPPPGPEGAPAAILSPFIIDRFEVTNARYRGCVEDGACPPPTANDSALRADYFSSQEYNDYPVVNVPWSAARAYCEWVGMRLPSAAEWEAAAGFAPATQRIYRYPWSDQFEPQFVVGADAGFLDTAQVGSRSPVGDSPLGASDMAGNVAEWTDTTIEGGEAAALVKGGSYLDGARGLEITATQGLNKSAAFPWLGFRCAASAS